jgi:acetyl esterase
MPLDAHSAALVEARRAAAIPPVREQRLEDARASRKAWREKAAPAPTPIDEVFERSVPVAGGDILVRVYRPASPVPLPVIVYFHGGGWVLGDLDHSDALCRQLAIETRAAVVNVDYRLAPEHRYPTAAEDGYAALLWAAAEMPGVPLAVAGASAGGNLAAAVALMARDRAGPALAAQLLAYPVLDDACDAPSFIGYGTGHIVETDDMRWYWEQYLTQPGDAAEPYACPLKAPDLAGLPPTLVITAENDPVRDDGERYAARLAEAGIRAKLTRYPGTLHGFFATPGIYDKTDAAITEAAAFLSNAFKGRP